MKKHQIMISSLAILALSCSSALADICGDDCYENDYYESCGEGCSYTIIFKKEGRYMIASISENTTSIPEGAFDGLHDYNFNEVIIPNSVKSIDSNAFVNMSYMTNLTSLTIPNSVTTIADYAFSDMYNGCSESLTNLTIGKNVKTIGDYAFNFMPNLQSLTIPDSVTTIGQEAFGSMWNLQSLTIPNSVTSIGDGAFNNMTSLISLTLPNSIESIGYWAFNNMTSLQSLTIPNSVKTIGQEAFSGMESLTSLTIPNSVESIGECAFAEMYSLQSLTIPDSVTTIGDYAFAYMESLTDLTIPDSATSIGQNAFLGMNESAQIYCEGTMCDMLDANRSYYGLDGQALIPYTKGENGVYEIDGVFYSSSENMQAGISCGSQAACAEEIKIAQQTQTSSEEETHIVRRIYTVEEATEAVSGKGKNTFTIRYR